MKRFFFLSAALTVSLSSAATTNCLIGTVAELKKAVYHPTPLSARFKLEATVVKSTTKLSSQIAVTDGQTVTRLSDGARWPTLDIRVGDRIHASGDMMWNAVQHANYALARTMEVLSHGEAPPPIEITPSEIYDRKYIDCVVRTKGTVIDVFRDELDPRFVFLVLSGDNIPTYVATSGFEANTLENLIDAFVSVTGWCRGYENSCSRDILDVCLETFDANAIRVIRPAPDDPFAVPLLKGGICQIVTTAVDKPQRRRIKGRVLAVWQGNNLLLRTQEGSISRLQLAQEPPPSCGDFIEAVGLPETDLHYKNLSRAKWRTTASWLADDPTPESVTAEFLLTDGQGHREIKAAYHGRTIRLTGLVRSLPTATTDDCRTHLECGSHRILVDFSSVRDVLKTLEPGSTVEITGACVMETENWRPKMPFPQIGGFSIVPQTADDIRILARPPWWTPGRLLAVIGTLFAILFAILTWTFFLRRLAEQRGRELAEEKSALIESRIKVSERTHLAVELHDSLAQNLTSASLEIETSDRLANNQPSEMRRHLDIAAKMLKSCREDLKNCMWDLRNRALEEPDMAKAVRVTLVPHIASTRLAVRFNVPRERLSDNTAHVVLRIIRELVLNAVRHGNAKLVMVAGETDGDQLRFSVKDDGAGFDANGAPGVPEGHFGLQGIRERIGRLGGTFVLESRPGGGCKATVSLVLPTDEN